MGNSNNHPERPSSAAGILSNTPRLGSGSPSYQETSLCPLCGKYHLSHRMRSGSGSSVPNLDYARGGGSLSSGQHLLYARGGGSLSSGQHLPYAREDIKFDSVENVADSEQRVIMLDSEGNMADSEQRANIFLWRIPAYDRSDTMFDLGENLADSEMKGVICQYHLRGKCSWGSNCRDVHCDLPYQWRLRRRRSQVWTYFRKDDNDGIERSFCDPTNERRSIFYHEMAIDFNSMSGKDNADCQFEIERLSTPSSVNHGNQSWRTKWLWYWRNPKAEWIQFGDRDNYEERIALIKNANLEEAFVANPNVLANFMTIGKNSFDYIVDFHNMTQFNIYDGTTRELRRRPEFISKVDFELNILRSVRNADNAVTNGIKAPANWSIPNGTDLSEHNELVPLKETDPEYDEIKNLFIVENAVILSIDRIENGDLWEKYMMKKSKMLKKKHEEQLGEKRVFHGTDDKNVPAICKQGFDVRLAGTANGSVQGKGCYFAKDSSKAHGYVEKDTLYSTMFVTKILPGEYALGTYHCCRPPHKDESDQSSDLYDSCVDHVENPSTFVIFDNNQMYPEYVIRYKVMNTEQKIDHYGNKESQENCKLESVEPEDEYVEHDDEYVKPDDKYVEPVDPGDEYLEPVDPGDENVESVEPDDKSVEPVKPDDEYVEPVDPGDEYVESVEPDDKSAEPVKPDNEYVEYVDTGDEYFESDDEYTE